MCHQPNTLPSISIRVLLTVLSMSLTSVGIAQAQSAYRCGANESVPENLMAISAALDICKEVHELNQNPNAESARIALMAVRQAALRASQEEREAESAVDMLRLQLPQLNKSTIGVLEISAAIIGIGGAVLGGSLRLSKNSSTARAGTWVGIGAGSAGGGLALVKGLSDEFGGEQKTKNMIPESVRRYILAQKPHFRFRTFRWNPPKLEQYVNAMENETLSLQTQLNIK